MRPTNVSAPIIKRLVWFTITRTTQALNESSRTQELPEGLNMGEHKSTNAYTEEMWNVYLRNKFGLDVSLKTLLLCVKIIFISVSELHLLLIMLLLNKKIGRTSTCVSTYYCNLSILFYILLYITWVSDSDIIILCIL